MLFPAEGRTFLQDLAANNNRDWFQANKKAYETHVKKPAALLAEAISEGLAAQTGTPFSHKIFRINRDVRFSADKTPYNTHVRFAFWPSNSTAEKPMTGTCFFLSIEANEWVTGCGCMQMPPEQLTTFRASLDNPKQAAELNKILATLAKEGFTAKDPELKRVPSGFDKDHAEAEHLKRKSLSVWKTYDGNADDITADDILSGFKLMQPLYIRLNKSN